MMVILKIVVLGILSILALGVAAGFGERPFTKEHYWWSANGIQIVIVAIAWLWEV